MEYFKAQYLSNQEPKLETHGAVPPAAHTSSFCRQFPNSQAECSGV